MIILDPSPRGVLWVISLQLSWGQLLRRGDKAFIQLVLCPLSSPRWWFWRGLAPLGGRAWQGDTPKLRERIIEHIYKYESWAFKNLNLDLKTHTHTHNWLNKLLNYCHPVCCPGKLLAHLLRHSGHIYILNFYIPSFWVSLKKGWIKSTIIFPFCFVCLCLIFFSFFSGRR